MEPLVYSNAGCDIAEKIARKKNRFTLFYTRLRRVTYFLGEAETAHQGQASTLCRAKQWWEYSLTKIEDGTRSLS